MNLLPLLLLILMLIDLATTYAGLELFGGIEGNPIISLMLPVPGLLLCIKVGAWVLIIGMADQARKIHRHGWEIVMCSGILVSLLPVVWNLAGICMIYMG